MSVQIGPAMCRKMAGCLVTGNVKGKEAGRRKKLTIREHLCEKLPHNLGNSSASDLIALAQVPSLEHTKKIPRKIHCSAYRSAPLRSLVEGFFVTGYISHLYSLAI